jgi:hypothetical protein
MNQIKCARWHCDKHVVKMILETTQLLYTAHWYVAISKGTLPTFKTAPTHSREPRMHGYLPVNNPSHPSALWARQSAEHYEWLSIFGLALCNEYRHRFSNKKHSCENHLRWLYQNLPPGLERNGFRDPPLAMPDEYKVSKNAVVSYRTYYKKGKTAILKYSGRHRPHWL